VDRSDGRRVKAFIVSAAVVVGHDGYWPWRRTTHRPPNRTSSQTSHRSLVTTTDEARVLKP
jgi:hypothetical protein